MISYISDQGCKSHEILMVLIMPTVSPALQIVIWGAGDLQIGLLIGDLAGGWFSEICLVRLSTLTCWTRLWILCLQWSSWLLVGAGLPMRCFSPCTTTIGTYVKELETLSSLSCLCMLYTVVILSILRRIDMLNFSWAKVWTASVAASNSRKLMWIVCSWGTKDLLSISPHR